MPGSCDAHFDPVRDAFDANFAAGLEVGAACAIVVNGRLVVDLWAGAAGIDGRPWQRDTLVDCRSATKALTAACLHRLVDNGEVDLDAPLRRYWPELRVDPTVRHALSHQAGVPIVDDLPDRALLDWDVVAKAVARQEPLWAPGERHGYHGVTFGWLIGEPVRRVRGAPLSEVLHDELIGPLGLTGECFMGTPASEHHRIADLIGGTPAQESAPPAEPTARAEGYDTRLAQRMYAPVWPPIAPPMNARSFRAATIPVTGAQVTARVHATLFARLPAALGAVQADGVDAVLGIPVTRTLGFERTPPWEADSRPAHCFGSPGGGGVLTFADPEAGVGFSYVSNASWSGAPGRDPRATSLARALYSCL